VFQAKNPPIVQANIFAFILDAFFIKHEQNKLKDWALYTMCSMVTDTPVLTRGLYFQVQDTEYGPIPVRT
jgi:hypothetical protein